MSDLGGTPEVDDGFVTPPSKSPTGRLLGQRLHGRYEVLRELGWGSLGRVYLVRDLLRPEGENEVALKVIRRDRLSPESVHYLKQEFRALSGLRHPNVAAVYDLDVVPGRGELFFTLEYLKGVTIVEQAQRDGWEAALDLFVQTLRALAFVHARGLIHMDIKPQNVLVLEGEEAERRVRVLDFHLVKRHAPGVRDRTMRGTIAYMAPEVIKGEPVDHRADLYSFGAVAYQALTGKPPFALAGNPMAILRAHARLTPPAFDPELEVPVALEAIVQRLLSKRPADRFPTANEVIRALNQGLSRSFVLETEETRRSYLRRGQFVGRAAEVERVLAAGRRLQQSEEAPESIYDSGAGFLNPLEPRVFRFVGEPGIGKSRLLTELKVELQLGGLPALLVRPRRVDPVPFGPILDALSELLRRADRDALLKRLSQDGRSIDPDLLVDAAPEEDLPSRVLRTAALADLFREVSRQSPFALIIDDADAADEGTRELLRLLGGRPRPEALLILSATVADDEWPGTSTLNVNRLTRAETGELLQSMVQAPEGLPETFVSRVWEATGGSPRFVEETLRNLAETGAIQNREGSLTITPATAETVLPGATLGELTAERVARLDPDAALLLGALAVTPHARGLAFSAAVARLSQPLAERAFRELERRGFVGRVRVSELPGVGVSDGGAPVVIEHEPLRAAALDRLGVEQEQALHLQAALLLESRHPVTLEGVGGAAPDRAEELLWHMERAGKLERAFRYATQAAEAARGQGVFLRARQLYGESLRLYDCLDAQDRAPSEPGHLHLTLRMAEALAATGERSRALELLRPLTEPLPRSAEGLRLRAAIRKDRGELRPALADLEQALRCAAEAQEQGESGAELEYARCLAERASVRLWCGDYEAARADGEAALPVLEKAAPRFQDARLELVRVQDELYHACRFLGLEEAATAHLQSGLAARGDASEEVRVRDSSDDVTTRYVSTALQRALKRGHAPLMGDASGALVSRTILEAAFERADQAADLQQHYLRRAQLLEGAGQHDDSAYAELNLAHLRRARGSLTKALRGYDRAAELFGKSDSLTGRVLVRLSRARLLAEIGAGSLAAREAREVETEAAAIGARWIEAQAILARAEAARASEDEPETDAQLARADALAQELKNVPLQAELALLRAELCLARAEGPEATQALATFDAFPAGARAVALRIRARLVDAGLALAAAPDDRAERARALDLATQALTEAELRGLVELSWRAAWSRAQLNRAAGDAASELTDLVSALSILREVSGPLPAHLREPYLQQRERKAVRDRFGEVRSD